jgi:hypothetical protein
MQRARKNYKFDIPTIKEDSLSSLFVGFVVLTFEISQIMGTPMCS